MATEYDMCTEIFGFIVV